MRPLMRDPVTTTIYRDETVTAGATYTYSVYAVDRATPSNVSQQSNRETITVR
jgi:fibronectin type 3 domain-containing protein